jgi:DNA-binding CsgD family transcriptional regulator
MVHRLTLYLSTWAEMNNAIPKLSPTQLRIMDSIAAGNNVKESAAELKLSVHTIHQHLYESCKIADMKNTTHLITSFVIWKIINELRGN